MFTLVHNTYLEVKRSSFLIFVVILAFCGAILATFFYGLGFNELHKSMFFVLGAVLGVGKFLIGMVAIFAQSPSETKVRKFAIVAFLLLTVISFVVGVLILDQNLNRRKAIVERACEQAHNIKESIKDQELILERLISQHKIDLESDNFTRSDLTYSKISEESDKIIVLLKSQGEINRNDLSFLPILDVLDYMIPFGTKVWQKIITVIFGSLLEIANMFLLYLIFEVSKQSVPFRNNVTSIATFYRGREEAVH